MRSSFEARYCSANCRCRAAVLVHAHAWVLSLDLSHRRPDRALPERSLGSMLPSTPPCGRSLDRSVFDWVSPVRLPAPLLDCWSPPPPPLDVRFRTYWSVTLSSWGPALASHRQTRLRSCVVEVGTLAWLGLSCAARSQPCRGSVGGRGVCDRIEAMLCHRARVAAGFRVRGMMLCHRASPWTATCVRNDTCGFSELCAPYRSGWSSSVALRAARVCAHVCMGSRARPAFASGGPGRWVDDGEPLSVQLLLGWTSRKALHRVGKLSRRHSRCHWMSSTAAGEALHPKQCSSGFYGNYYGYSVLTRGGRHVLQYFPIVTQYYSFSYLVLPCCGVFCVEFLAGVPPA